jgi:hypothetical protein
MVAQVLAAPLVVVNHPHSHAVGGKIDFVGKMRKGPCGRNRFRQKAVDISNLFREALGLPLIKTGSHHDGKVTILPFIGSATLAPVHGHGKDAKGTNIETLHDGHHHGYHHTKGSHRHHNHHHHTHDGKGSFINRVHYSIMNLGRWEGGAVAFVLGKIPQSLFFSRFMLMY